MSRPSRSARRRSLLAAPRRPATAAGGSPHPARAGPCRAPAQPRHGHGDTDGGELLSGSLLPWLPTTATARLCMRLDGRVTGLCVRPSHAAQVQPSTMRRPHSTCVRSWAAHLAPLQVQPGHPLRSREGRPGVRVAVHHQGAPLEQRRDHLVPAATALLRLSWPGQESSPHVRRHAWLRCPCNDERHGEHRFSHLLAEKSRCMAASSVSDLPVR